MTTTSKNYITRWSNLSETSKRLFVNKDQQQQVQQQIQQQIQQPQRNNDDYDEEEYTIQKGIDSIYANKKRIESISLLDVPDVPDYTHDEIQGIVNAPCYYPSNVNYPPSLNLNKATIGQPIGNIPPHNNVICTTNVLNIIDGFLEMLEQFVEHPNPNINYQSLGVQMYINVQKFKQTLL